MPPNISCCHIPAPTVILKELSSNLNTPLAASSGTETTSVVSLAELVDSLGAIEVAGTKQTSYVKSFN